jgi:PilZ domain
MNSETTIERRQCARLQTLNNEIVLQWQESTGAYSSDGKLLNISDRGALVVLNTPVPSTGSVFIRMKTPVKTDWITAWVVRRGTNNELGMEFPDTCQWDFKLAALMGIDFNGLFSLSDTERFSHSGD